MARGIERSRGELMEMVEKKKQPNYYFIWFLLLVLTVVEVGIAYLSGLPRSVLILVLVGLAIWKATLVAMYYMHLRFERLRVILLASAPLPLAVILVLAILLEYAR
ncbi:MAG: cytochrome C oxidase subunit IV family protein [Gemmatimonadota bacterium]|nr:MAG: cytochrome C oxidase subunit IV family protein [Gemmatimonadota bacterium]